MIGGPPRSPLLPYTTLFGSQGFAPGRTLTVTATFSDGSSAQAVTTVTNTAVTVSAVTPNQGTMGTTVAETGSGHGLTQGTGENRRASSAPKNNGFLAAPRPG